MKTIWQLNNCSSSKVATLHLSRLRGTVKNQGKTTIYFRTITHNYDYWITHIFENTFDISVEPSCRKHAWVPKKVSFFRYLSCTNMIALFEPFCLIWNEYHLLRELFRAYLILNVYSRRYGRVPTRKRAYSSVKIAFFIRIFGAFNQIMKQPATFLFFFRIPRWFSIVITWKFKQTNLG